MIGGGVNGLSTAYHLSNQNNLKVGLIEQFSMGHSYGSSHGFSRIFRTTYANPVYIKLAKRANVDEWPAFEKDLNCKLLYPCSRCLFGFGKDFEKYIEAAKTCEEIEILDVAKARKRFPQLSFLDSSQVLLDYSSKIIAAKDLMDRLAQVVISKNVAIYDKTQATAIHSEDREIRVQTNVGLIGCQRLVITAGPWVQDLLPDLKSHVCSVRQTVGYYTLQGERERYRMGHFPIWVYFGEGENNLFYGLPEFGCSGIKVTQEVFKNTNDDPNALDSLPDERAVQILEEFVKKCFVDQLIKTEKIESCFYTTTPTQDFILDLFPKDPRIIIGSACSGHSFKFAPLTGKILSELALNATTTISEFEEDKQLFAFKGI